MKKRAKKLILLTAISMAVSACADTSSFDQSLNAMSGAGSASYTRTIFSTHNF